MSMTVHEHQAEIVRLTKVAVEAAQQGKWDEVIQGYNERGILLASGQISTMDISELRMMDEQVRERAKTAQVLLAELLDEAEITKQRLLKLRDQIGVLNMPPASVSMKA